MRCTLCDTSSTGLTYFNIDRPQSTSFTYVNDDLLCDQCFDGYSEVLDDFYLEDTLKEEEG